MGDLDLLVPKTRIGEAIELGIACGFVPDRDVHLQEWLKTKHQACAQYHPQSQLMLEWHWHIAPPRLNTAVSIDTLWQRAKPATLCQKPILALALEDTVLHLAYHISYHHHFLFGVRNLCDLSLLCHRYQGQIDWDIVHQRAQAWRYARGVYLALLMARQHLAAPVPEAVFNGLKPSDFASRHFELATQQIFVDPQGFQKISLTRRNVMSANGLMPRARALGQALFPSPAAMALRYGIEPGSKSRLGLYWFRWRSLAGQALSKMGQQGGETAVSTTLKRKRQLSTWLEAADR